MTPSFPAFPVSPLSSLEGDGGYTGALALRNRTYSFLDGLYSPQSIPSISRISRASSASSLFDAPFTWSIPSDESFFLSTISNHARAFTITGTTSSRDTDHIIEKESQEEDGTAVVSRPRYWSNRSFHITDMNIDASMCFQMTRESFPWPTTMESTDFLALLESSMQLHTRGCQGWASPAADCDACIGKLNTLSAVTLFFQCTPQTGEALVALRDCWNPDDYWIEITVVPADQHFVRRGMLLIHECIGIIIEGLRTQDPLCSPL